MLLSCMRILPHKYASSIYFTRPSVANVRHQAEESSDTASM